VSSPTEQAEKARRIISRWRKLFLGIYLVFVVVSVLVTFFSVLAFHLGVHQVPIKGTRISATADDPKELRACHRRLSRLMTDLHKEAFSLLAHSQRFETHPARAWENWSRDWHHRWRVLDHHCRLSELSGRGVSPEIDKMARIHQALDELHISYTGVVNNFAERYVDRLRTLREEVASVRAMIDRRKRRGHRSTPGASQ
jgi:hypothetical protein